MKLSDYAKKIGISYDTAYRMFKDKQLDAYQLPTGTIIVNDTKPSCGNCVAIYAKKKSRKEMKDLEFGKKKKIRRHTKD